MAPCHRGVFTAPTPLRDNQNTTTFDSIVVCFCKIATRRRVCERTKQEKHTLVSTFHWITAANCAFLIEVWLYTVLQLTLSVFFNLKKTSNNRIRLRVSHVKLIRELIGVLRSPSVRHCWRALLLLSAGSSSRAAVLRRRDAVSWRCESDKRIPAEAPTGAGATLGK